MNKEALEKTLRDIYYDTTNPGSYGGVAKLFNQAKLANSDITLSFVKDWLSGEFSYSLHKWARKKFQRNKVHVRKIDEQFQADLVDMQEFARVNNGFRYILTVIDILSKFAWAIPLKNKSANTVLEAFKTIFSSRKPIKLQTDRGREFLNAKLQKYLRDQHVVYFTSFNDDVKCPVVERFNRTLKTKMFRYFTAKGTRKYIDVLPNLVKSYNNSYHKSIKMTPNQVTPDREAEAYLNLYEQQKYKRSPGELHVNDTVRRKLPIGPLEKGFYPLWTDQLFKVHSKIYRPTKLVYKLQNDKGEELPKTFYQEEVQKVKPDLYRVENVLRTRTRNGVKETLVKWLGYTSDYNSWITASMLEALK